MDREVIETADRLGRENLARVVFLFPGTGALGFL
ncbi:MAG: hypothetical protein PHAS_01465 [Phascolarctobacterium sp.]